MARPTAPPAPRIIGIAYDSMNRVVVDKGMLPAARSCAARTGIDYTLRRAGPAGDRDQDQGYERGLDLDQRTRTGQGEWVTKISATTRAATYVYRSDGRAQRGMDRARHLRSGGGRRRSSPAFRSCAASYAYDAMRRVTSQTDWLGNGTNAGYDRTVSYNAKGQIATDDRTSTKRLNDIFTS